MSSSSACPSDLLRDVAERYVYNINSFDQYEVWLVKDVKNYAPYYVTAILKLHEDPSIGFVRLCDVVSDNDWQLDEDKMEIVTDFFLRHDLQDRSKRQGGHSILSGYQMSRRRRRESWTLFDDVDYGKT